MSESQGSMPVPYSLRAVCPANTHIHPCSWRSTAINTQEEVLPHLKEVHPEVEASSGLMFETWEPADALSDPKVLDRLPAEDRIPHG